MSPHMVYMCSCKAMQSAVQKAIALGIDAKGSYTGHARSMSLSCMAGACDSCALSLHCLQALTTMHAMQLFRIVSRHVYMLRQSTSSQQSPATGLGQVP